MDLNREYRTEQVLLEWQKDKTTSIRARTARYDIDRITLGRRIKGGISRTLVREL